MADNERIEYEFIADNSQAIASTKQVIDALTEYEQKLAEVDASTRSSEENKKFNTILTTVTQIIAQLNKLTSSIEKVDSASLGELVTEFGTLDTILSQIIALAPALDSLKLDKSESAANFVAQLQNAKSSIVAINSAIAQTSMPISEEVENRLNPALAEARRRIEALKIDTTLQDRINAATGVTRDLGIATNTARESMEGLITLTRGTYADLVDVITGVTRSIYDTSKAVTQANSVLAEFAKSNKDTEFLSATPTLQVLANLDNGADKIRKSLQSVTIDTTLVDRINEATGVTYTFDNSINTARESMEGLLNTTSGTYADVVNVITGVTKSIDDTTQAVTKSNSVLVEFAKNNKNREFLSETPTVQVLANIGNSIDNIRKSAESITIDTSLRDRIDSITGVTKDLSVTANTARESMAGLFDKGVGNYADVVNVMTGVTKSVLDTSTAVTQANSKLAEFAGANKNIEFLSETPTMEILANLGNGADKIRQSFQSIKIDTTLQDQINAITGVTKDLDGQANTARESMEELLNQKDANETAESLKKTEDAARSVTKVVETLGSGITSLGRGMVSFSHEIRSWTTAFNIADDALSTFGNTFKDVLGITNELDLGESISNSVDMVENLNLFTVAMKDAVGEGQELIAELNTLYGYDPSYLAETIGYFQELGNAVGVPTTKLSEFASAVDGVNTNSATTAASKLSLGLTELAVDLSSLFNYDMEQVTDNLSSGLRGITKSVYKYGIDVRATVVEQYALSNGIKENYETMNEASREILRYLVMLEQTTDATGDFARTIEAPANQLRVLQQLMTQLGRAIANFVIQPLSQALPYINGFVWALQTVIQYIAVLTGMTNWMSPSLYEVGEGAESGADGLADIGSAASSASKAVKDLIAPFDELNVLNEDAGGGGGASGLSFDTVDPEILKLLADVQRETDKIGMKAEKVRDQILEFFGLKMEEPIFDEETGEMVIEVKWITDTSGVEVGLEIFKQNLLETFPNYTLTIEALFGVNWENVLGILGQTKEILLEIAGIALDQVGINLKGIFEVITGTDLSDASLAEFITNIETELTNFNVWLDENKIDVGKVLGDIGTFALLSPIIGDMILPIALVIGAIGTLIATVGKAVSFIAPALGSLAGIFGSFGLIVVGAIAAIVVAFGAWLFTTEDGQETLGLIVESIGRVFTQLGATLGAVLSWLMTTFEDTFGFIGAIIDNFLVILEGILLFIEGVFSGDIDKALDGIMMAFSGAFAGILNVGIFLVNELQDMFSKVLTFIIDLLEGPVAVMDKILGTSIGDSMKSWGANVAAFDIPYVTSADMTMFIGNDTSDTDSGSTRSSDTSRREAHKASRSNTQSVDVKVQIGDETWQQLQSSTKVSTGRTDLVNVYG